MANSFGIVTVSQFKEQASNFLEIIENCPSIESLHGALKCLDIFYLSIELPIKPEEQKDIKNTLLTCYKKSCKIERLFLYGDLYSCEIKDRIAIDLHNVSQHELHKH